MTDTSHDVNDAERLLEGLAELIHALDTHLDAITVAHDLENPAVFEQSLQELRALVMRLRAFYNTLRSFYAPT